MMTKNNETLDIGLLVLGYSRPELFETAARSLRHLGLPQTTPRYGVIDGTRHSNGYGFEANQAVQTRGESLLEEGILTDLTIRRANLGTMQNVYRSVTEVLERHEFVFVLEDDLEILPMAKGALPQLIRHVGCDVTTFGIYCHKSWSQGLFLSQRFSSQGWGTSRDGWRGFDVEEIKNLNLSSSQKKLLCDVAGTDMVAGLRAFQIGLLDSWAIPWNVFNFLHGRKMIYTPNSYVTNKSHLAGAERTWGIEFRYETASRPLVGASGTSLHLNQKYLKHFSRGARLKRRFWAEVAKKIGR